MKKREPCLLPLILHPFSLIVMNCKFASRVDHPLVEETSRLCLKPADCTCLTFGKTIQDDLLDPTQTRDDVDRFVDGDKFDNQSDSGM